MWSTGSGQDAQEQEDTAGSPAPGGPSCWPVRSRSEAKGTPPPVSRCFYLDSFRQVRVGGQRFFLCLKINILKGIFWGGKYWSPSAPKSKEVGTRTSPRKPTGQQAALRRAAPALRPRGGWPAWRSGHPLRLTHPPQAAEATVSRPTGNAEGEGLPHHVDLSAEGQWPLHQVSGLLEPNRGRTLGLTRWGAGVRQEALGHPLHPSRPHCLADKVPSLLHVRLCKHLCETQTWRWKDSL